MTTKRYKAFYEENKQEPGIYITTIRWKASKGGAHATVLQRFDDGSLAYIEPQHFNGYMKRDIMELCVDGAGEIYKGERRGIMRVDDKVLKRYCNGLDIWSIFTTE